MLLKILYGAIRNAVTSGQNHEPLKTSCHDLKAKIAMQVLRDQSGGGGASAWATPGRGGEGRLKSGLKAVTYSLWTASYNTTPAPI